MKSSAKSTFCSLALHAVLLAVAYAVPTVATQRFSASGSQDVISIELSQAYQPAAASFAVQPPESMVEPPAEIQRSLQEADALQPREEPVDLQPQRPSSDLPRIESAELAWELNLQRQFERVEPTLSQRLPPIQVDETKMTEAIEVSPQIPRSRPLANAAPAAAPVPVEQSAGISDEKAADMSQNQPPAYPADAIGKRLEGTVLLRLHIAVDGRVDSVEVVKSSGHASLDRAAIEAVRTWKGQPATRYNRPVASTEVLPIRFRL